MSKFFTRYASLILGRPQVVTPIPQPMDVPDSVHFLNKALSIGRDAAGMVGWAVPAGVAALWMTYPAMTEPIRRMLIPGYAFLYPAIQKPADEEIPGKESNKPRDTKPAH